MKRLIEHFERSYIINLKDRPDRRFETIQEFRKIGFDFPNYRIRFYNATRPLDKGVFPTVGNRGCFTSHRTVLELADADRLSNVLVFEDDVAFAKIDPTIEQALIDQVQREDWDVIYFGYGHPRQVDGTEPLVELGTASIGRQFFAVNGRFIPIMMKYMQDCEGRPIGHPLGGPMPADGAYNHIRRVRPKARYLISRRNLAYQRSSRTDGQWPGFFDRVGLIAPLVRYGRHAKNLARRAS